MGRQGKTNAMQYLAEARSLGHLFQLSCRHWGGKTSHIVPGKGGHRDVSFAEVYEATSRYAVILRELGLQKGDRMVIFGENSFEWALADWAAQNVGVVTVPIYPSLPPDQAQYIAQDSGAKVALCGVAELVKRLEGLSGIQTYLLSEIAARAEVTTPDADWQQSQLDQVKMDDLATIIYTSGTTGNPKGVILTHH
ncbi:MAG: AMP-binding protein, partial [Fimbriimonadaceae bacterium]|nr:AMP-binding protein [Fimbriimonadaceae bacterium]